MRWIDWATDGEVGISVTSVGDGSAFIGAVLSALDEEGAGAFRGRGRLPSGATSHSRASPAHRPARSGGRGDDRGNGVERDRVRDA